VVYKQLVIHPDNAMAGALAFCAAANQGKHDEMNNLVWEKGFKGKSLDASRVDGKLCWETPEGCKNVVSYAQELGLDVDKFKADMKECTKLAEKDKASMNQFGVGGTPAFFVNGRFVPGGAAPFERFVPIIDEELAKANDAIQKGEATQADYYEKVIVGKGLKKLDG
jgi:predicted DsbA family dithiol-disulfide isomerase